MMWDSQHGYPRTSTWVQKFRSLRGPFKKVFSVILGRSKPTDKTSGESVSVSFDVDITQLNMTENDCLNPPRRFHKIQRHSPKTIWSCLQAVLGVQG